MLHSDPTSAITARLEELPFSDPRNNGLALRLRYARSVWRRVQWRWCNSPGSRFSALEGRLECAALDLPGQRHAFCRRRRVLAVPAAAPEAVTGPLREKLVADATLATGPLASACAASAVSALLQAVSRMKLSLAWKPKWKGVIQMSCFQLLTTY